MISLDGSDTKGPQGSGELREAKPSDDCNTRTEKSTSKHSSGVCLHPADSTRSTSSSLTSLDTVITLPRPPDESPFASCLASPIFPNDSTPLLNTRSFCTLARSGSSVHTSNPQKSTASSLKTSRSAEALSSSATTSLSSSPAEAGINGGILEQASATSYSSTCSTCSSGVDQTDSRANGCSSITIGSTSNSCSSHSPSSASKESLSSCCSASSLPLSSSITSSSSSPPIGAFESAPLATTTVITATTTTFSPYFVPVCTAFSGLPACPPRTHRSPSPRRESPISVTATEANSSLRQSVVTVSMENPVVLETPCCRHSCAGCCSWFTAPEPVVLLACGSFNPITTMHLRMMELARDAIEKTWSFPSQSSSGDAGSTSSGEPLDPARELCQVYLTRSPRRQIVVAGILSPVSDGYAKAGLAPAESRCRLARLACATTSDWLAVDTWEASQPDWSCTRIVFEHLQARLNCLAELPPEEVDRLLLTKGSSLARSETTSPTTEENRATSQTLDSSDELPGIASDVWLCERLLDAQNLADRFGTLGPCRCFHKEHQQCHLPSESTHSREACSTTGESNAFGRLPRARVKLVCGADLLQSFATPGLWSAEDMETLVRDFGIICISRPQSDAARLLNELDVLAKHEQNVILVTEWCQNGLSATLVRRALARGQSVRYLVPDAALEEIYAAGLYGARRRRLDNPAGTEAVSRRARLFRHAADRSLHLEPRPDEKVSQEKLADKGQEQENLVKLQPGH